MSRFEDDLSILQKEPALVTGIVVAVVGVLASVGLQIDDSTTAAASSLIMAVLAFVGAVVIRKQVTPNGKVDSTPSVPDGESGVADSTTEVSDEDRAAVEEALSNDEAVDLPEVDESHLDEDSEVTEVPEQPTDVVDSNVESDSDVSKDDSLAEALKALTAAVAAKESAQSETAKALEAVQAKAASEASVYAAKIAEAQQKLAEVQAK